MSVGGEKYSVIVWSDPTDELSDGAPGVQIGVPDTAPLAVPAPRTFTLRSFTL